MRNDLQDFRAESDGQLVERERSQLAARRVGLLDLSQGAVEDFLIFGHLDRLEQQGWIGRGVAGLVLANALEITRVGNNHAELFELT